MKTLLTIDGSPHRAAALEEVDSRQGPAGTEVEGLTVVHSVTQLWVDPALALAAAYVETMQELRTRAPELLAAAAARLGRDPADLRIRAGRHAVSVRQ